MDGNRKLLNLIGLATKAGKTVSGEFSTEKAVKTGKAKAVRFSTLEEICRVLDCQPGDILEYRKEE